MYDKILEEENLIVLEEEKLPKDKYKNKGFFKEPFHFKDGGFADSIFLGSIVATAGLWFILYVLARK